MRKQILTNGNVFSFKTSSVAADTVEISDGVITRVGFHDEIINTSPDADIVDLRQSLVLPGFIDAHIHLLAYGQSLLRVDLSKTRSKAECLEEIRLAADGTDAGSWIIGHGWDHNQWPEGYGSRDDLDEVTQRHPVFLTHKSLHCAWANSTALKLAGIGSKENHADSKLILRGRDNQPTGILLEGAMLLVQNAIPVPASDDIRQALIAAQNSLNQYGITGVHDFDPWMVHDGMRNLQEDNLTTLRVMKSIPEKDLEHAIEHGHTSGSGNDWMHIGWLKLFADGALGPQTAAMLDPYEQSDQRGLLLMDESTIAEIGEVAMRAGISLAVHAIGDRANHVVLSAFEKLDKMGFLSIPKLSPRVEHVQIITPHDLRKFKTTNTTASMQPIHAISDMDMADRYWGKRSENAYAWRSILDADAELIFGSDAPVETPNPMAGLAAAISRRRILSPSHDSNKKEWNPQQQISLIEALRAYCSTPVKISGFRETSGAIEPGYYADLVLLPPNFLMAEADEIIQTRPTATIVNGNWVYKNDKIDIELKK